MKTAQKILNKIDIEWPYMGSKQLEENIIKAMEKYAEQFKRTYTIEDLKEAFEQGQDFNNDPHRYNNFQEWYEKRFLTKK